jgi:hypothetical protein
MSDTKISQLPSATTVNTTDELPINNAGTTRKTTLQKIGEVIGYVAHAANAAIHRQINDSGTLATELWSAAKIITELAGKANSSHNHNASDITAGTLPVERGGSGLSTFAAGKLMFASALNTFAELALGSSLAIGSNTLEVVNNTSIQKITLAKAGVDVGTRPKVNVIDGSGISTSVVDNSASDRIDMTINVTTQALPAGYRGTAQPVYATAATFTVAYIRDRNSADDGDIVKTTSTTVDISAFGLNGVAQSALLGGTIGTGGASSATITGSGTAFSTDFMVGDVIWTASGARRITAIGSNVSLTVESAITLANGTGYKRGGEAPNTFYNLYAITNGTTLGLILSTRNVAGGETLVDLPSGYNKSRQQPFTVKNDGSSNIVDFYVSHGWPYRPLVMYRVDYSAAGTGATNISVSLSATSFTALSLAAYCPPIARHVLLHLNSSVANSISLRETGSALTVGFTTTIDGNGAHHLPYFYPVNASQSLDYKVTAGTLKLDVAGFVVTEVA